MAIRSVTAMGRAKNTMTVIVFYFGADEQDFTTRFAAL